MPRQLGLLLSSDRIEARTGLRNPRSSLQTLAGRRCGCCVFLIWRLEQSRSGGESAFPHDLFLLRMRTRSAAKWSEMLVRLQGL